MSMSSPRGNAAEGRSHETREFLNSELAVPPSFPSWKSFSNILVKAKRALITRDLPHLLKVVTKYQQQATSKQSSGVLSIFSQV